MDPDSSASPRAFFGRHKRHALKPRQAALVETLLPRLGLDLAKTAPADPRTLFVYVVNVARLFDPRVVELRVRAEGVPDPTGNAITSDDADAQQVAGTDVQ